MKDDFEEFEHIVVFDEKNIRDTLDMGPPGFTRDKLVLLGTHDSSFTSDSIEDPYYASSEKDFEITFQICERACKSFLDSIQ